jgi:hypothetical protein
VHEILISPVLYVSMVLVNSRLKQAWTAPLFLYGFFPFLPEGKQNYSDDASLRIWGMTLTEPRSQLAD